MAVVMKCLVWSLPIMMCLAQSYTFEEHVEGRSEPECTCSQEKIRKETHCQCSGLTLMEVPTNLSLYLSSLSVSQAGMEVLKASSFNMYRQTIKDIHLSKMKNLKLLEPGVFDNLLQLRTIYISGSPLLEHIAPEVFSIRLPNLKFLRIVHTGLKSIPYLHQLNTNNIITSIDLESNQISQLPTHAVQVKAEEVILNFNSIGSIERRAFEKSQISKLTLRGNPMLTQLHPEAFEGIQHLRQLDLSMTSITFLATKGLEELEILYLQDTPTLKVFPSIYNFKNILQAWLTYPYHCCAFQFPATHDPAEYARNQEMIRMREMNCSEDVSQVVMRPTRFSRDISSSHLGNFSEHQEIFQMDQPDSYDSSDGMFHQSSVSVRPFRVMCGNLSKNYRDVRCEPVPDAFNPCEDLMGNWALRVAVWIVAISALFGNLAVLLVLLSSRFRMTVPKFLMCNLASADLFMGLYLFLIAVMDARSVNVYFNYAIDWQSGLGCQVAGFFTVLASELSIFTLTVITCERWYTITYAIHLNKRLKLRTAGQIMAVGWLYSLVMAVLPLVGVSNYSKTSLCLPLESKEDGDVAYLVTLLIFNALAFWMICTCYGRMYCSIRDGQNAAQTRSDMTVAKKMALLVFTDFACWAPIAFFGLTALAGFPLIDVPKTKILLVFFYPLNSCANPYLYALLTQQYRRDLFILLSRYGLCAERATRYKGAPGVVPRCNTVGGGCNGRGEKCSNGGNGQVGHRGSLLTTLTSVDGLPIRPMAPLHEHQFSTVELLPTNDEFSISERDVKIHNSSFL